MRGQRRMMGGVFRAAVLGVILALGGTAAALPDVGLTLPAAARLPLGAQLRDERGQAHALGDYLAKGPVLLVLGYHRCAALCPQVLAGLVGSLRVLPLRAGADYAVLVVSIDPHETALQAEQRRRSMLRRIHRGHDPGADPGWHFLTGDAAAIGAVTAAVGLRSAYDAASDQFLHPAAVLSVDRQGRVGHLFPGPEYAPGELLAQLGERPAAADPARLRPLAAGERLLCYRYDPRRSRLGLRLFWALRLAGAMTLLALALLLWRGPRPRSWREGRR